MRIVTMVAFDAAKKSFSRKRDNKTRVLIFTGRRSDKAVSLVTRLRTAKHYEIAGFIAIAEPNNQARLAGYPLHSVETAADLEALHETCDVDAVLFPHDEDVRAESDRLIHFCQEANVKTLVTPGIDEMDASKPLTSHAIRKIRIEDLLNRPEIKISMDEIKRNFQGKTILVTGAAGSIGSELCRQLATFGIGRLVMLDNAETPLHNVRLEFEERFPDLDFRPVIGDVRQPNRLNFIFRKYRPQVVFHAAAYKHVPLMEENPCEAVLANVIGSRNVADKCVAFGVEAMVMISTDKAVNPTNIMGCTKRLAEIYVQSLSLAIERGEIKGNTRFVTTRFGNVLGSNGSVIPRFTEQIENGGPLTVTHPEIERFFMTIPEACRLVMEDAKFGKGKNIFVFDMGQPVTIRSLAGQMIRL
ncbi:MAG: polysaccharide biosynthesis protein, partial [Muribaculaceae bacterium]|nr:polysaccharide biosynthesis protein [Muribaculaceae bacterium]